MPVVNPGISSTQVVQSGGLLLLEPDEPESPLIIPGPTGLQGIQGIQGLSGQQGLLIIEPNEPELPLIIPGPQGPIGPQGPSGSGGSNNPSYVDLDNYEPDVPPLIHIPSPKYIKRILGTSGDAGPFETWQVLSGDSTPNTTTSFFDANALVMTTTGVGPGRWAFRYKVLYTTVITTTGVGLALVHTGTTTTPAGTRYYVYQIGTGTTASTGIGDNAAGTGPPGAIGQLMEGYITNSLVGAAAMFSIGIISNSAPCMMIIDGVVNVTVNGSLELRIASEIATSGVNVQAGTTLELKKVA